MKGLLEVLCNTELKDARAMDKSRVRHVLQWCIFNNGTVTTVMAGDGNRS